MVLSETQISLIVAIEVKEMQESNAVIPPGLLIGDELEARGLSQRELAAAMRRPVNAVHEIIRGKKAITPRTALDLELVA